MNRDIYLIKKYFCKFNCPNKNKNITNELVYNVVEKLDRDDFDKYAQTCVKTILDEELEGFICDNCPLESFINRLEDEKIIEE